MIQHQKEVIKCVLVREALYNLDHPLEYVPKSIEVQRACMKEMFLSDGMPEELSLIHI